MHRTEWFEQVAQRLAGIRPELCPYADRKPAAVALLLRQTGDSRELLFIERAHDPDDPWAGNIGFPGGRRDPVDRSLRHTAERETLEEVGIDLAAASYLGQLSDVVGANLPVKVSCFVYGLHTEVEPVLSDEVHDAFWFDLQHLVQPQRQVTAQVSFGGSQLEATAIDLGLPGKMVLWGLTYRLVCQFCRVMESDAELLLPYELPL